MSNPNPPAYNEKQQEAYAPQMQQNYQIPQSGQLVPPPPGMPVNWMPRPQSIPGVPLGLEYLTQLDQIQVEQIPNMLEILTGWDMNNRYALRNAAGQQFIYAGEQTDTCMRICCGPQREFTIHLIDNLNQEVIRVHRQFKCMAGCCWCADACDGCAHELVVESPPGTPIGYVRQRGSAWKPHYDILDEQRNCVLKVQGPCCILDGPCCPVDNEFLIFPANSDGANSDQVIGKISKHYAGFVREMVHDAHQFGVYFPINLAVKVKGTLIGAMFLIHFMFFERKNSN